MNTILQRALPLFLCLPWLAAQDAQAGLRALTSPWLAPLHTASAGSRDATYGVWASGPDFKASFHDGATFYPLLGTSRPHNLPLRLTTTAVRVGETALLAPGATPEHAYGTWRYEYRHGPCTEAYDVSERGVEQTFTFTQRPAATGDLVIEVAVASELAASARAPEHAELVFAASDGEALVRYGAAFAVDAAGVRTPLRTGFDGTKITLLVPAALVASAAYPLVVDPLLSRVLLSTEPTSAASAFAKIGAEPTGATHGVLLAYSRYFAGADADCYAQSLNHDLGNHKLVLADVSASFSSRAGGVAYAGGSKQWAIALEREYLTPNRSWCDIYFHGLGVLTLNGGANWNNPSTGTSVTIRNPDIGGTDTGSYVLIVYQADPGPNPNNTPNTRVAGWAISADTRQGYSMELDTNPGDDDCENPTVVSARELAQNTWVVAYQRRDNTVASNRFEIWVNQAHLLNGAGTSVKLAATPTPAFDLVVPRIDGRDGNYLVTYMLSPSATLVQAKTLAARRLRWPVSSTIPQVGPERIVHQVTAAADFLVNGDLACDPRTRSHWVAVLQTGDWPGWDIVAVRLGMDARVTESVITYAQATTGGFTPTVAFLTDSFCIAHTTNESPGMNIYGRSLVYDPAAGNSVYGQSCGGRIEAGLPYSGHEFFEFKLGGAAASSSAGLLLGAGLANVPLDLAGMPSCFLHVANVVTTLPCTTSASGNGIVRVALPEAVSGDVYVQFVVLDPAVPWETKATTTQGLLTRVRR